MRASTVPAQRAPEPGGEVPEQRMGAVVDDDLPGALAAGLRDHWKAPDGVGDPNRPILYEVDRIRDSRTFATRRVRAIQHGRPIFGLTASFQIPEEGYDHQFPMPPTQADPETLPDFRARMAPWKDLLGDWYDRPRSIDTRYPDWHPPDDRTPGPMFENMWFRANGTLPDDPVLHQCVVAYASDISVLDTSLRPHGAAAVWARCSW